MLTYRIIIVFRPDSVPIRARPRQPSFLAESLKRAGLYVQARYGVYRILVTAFIIVDLWWTISHEWLLYKGSNL